MNELNLSSQLDDMVNDWHGFCLDVLSTEFRGVKPVIRKEFVLLAESYRWQRAGHPGEFIWSQSRGRPIFENLGRIDGWEKLAMAFVQGYMINQALPPDDLIRVGLGRTSIARL